MSLDYKSEEFLVKRVHSKTDMHEATNRLAEINKELAGMKQRGEFSQSFSGEWRHLAFLLEEKANLTSILLFRWIDDHQALSTMIFALSQEIVDLRHKFMTPPPIGWSKDVLHSANPVDISEEEAPKYPAKEFNPPTLDLGFGFWRDDIGEGIYRFGPCESQEQKDNCIDAGEWLSAESLMEDERSAPENLLSVKPQEGLGPMTCRAPSYEILDQAIAIAEEPKSFIDKAKDMLTPKKKR